MRRRSLLFAWQADLRGKVAAAMRREDEAAVRSVAEEMRAARGAEAGEPEVADRYAPVPAGARLLTPEEARTGFVRYQDAARQRRWWRRGVDPTGLTRALREPASFIGGAVAAGAGAGAQTREAADFLIWAQQEAGNGVFPFPAARGPAKDAAFAVAARFLERARREGRMEGVVRRGWIVADGGDGGLQFDNGEAAVALLDLYRVTRATPWLDAARRAGEWALRRPCVPNWNYNSFSVWLLAHLHAETGESRWLEGARKKATLGVLPGQLQSGRHAGRWADAHNARPAYHYIMLRSLAALAKADPGNVAVSRALEAGLLARNREVVERGLMNKDSLIECLLAVKKVFGPDFQKRTLSGEALDAAERFVAAEYRSGKLPVAPRVWGMLIAERVRVAA